MPKYMHVNMSPLMMIGAVGMGISSAYLAYKRGRNPYAWFAIGVLFGIFGLFAIFFVGGQKKIAPPPRPEPVLKIHGPSDKFWFYLDLAQQQQGPMSLDALTAAWKEGKLDLATYVWHEELPDWKPLKETLRTCQTTE